MEDRLKDYVIYSDISILDALKKIDANRKGFALVTDANGIFLGVLTDGDIRRALLKGASVQDAVDTIYNRDAKKLCVGDGLDVAAEQFKDQSVNFLPIVDSEGVLKNIITKKDIHTLLLKDIHADLTYDFSVLDTSIIDHEIYIRPWGFYKTTVFNDFYQAKVISVKPGGQLSLQTHEHREEHWVVVHGKGSVQVDESVIEVSCGSSVFIPKGAKHRLINNSDEESLIISEVQIGDYLGEDDVIRYEDIYGRA